MADLTNVDKLRLESFLGMRSGYVLDFSNRTFSDFILGCTKKNIWDDRYNYGSGSKANRLRYFWDQEPNALISKLLIDILEYWKAKKQINNEKINTSEQTLHDEVKKIAVRLSGNRSESVSSESTEDEFINRQFKDVSLEHLGLDGSITEILKQRLEETRKCLNANASLATIFLCGSTLEGILLGIASKSPKEFNKSNCSPKDKEGKTLPFHEWSLSNFIDVSRDLGLVGEDVKKFSHALRDFRNYIHPYQQVVSQFNPDKHTAKICWQVLQAAIFQLSANKA